MVKVGWRAVSAAVLLASVSAIAATAPAKAPPPQAATAAGDPVVARVNGTEIRQSDLNTAYDSLPGQFHQMPKEQLLPAVLDQLIDRRLAALAAEKKNVAADPAVARELAQAREDVLQSAYLKSFAAASVTPAAVKARYDLQLKSFKAEPEVRARHILVHDEAAARAASARIKKGEAFEKVAREVSTDGSAADGGDLGFFTADKMVPEFSEVAFKLKPGAVSEPFKSRFGWHIVKVEAKDMTKPPAFAEVQNEIKTDMTNALVDQAIAGLRKGAQIEKTAAAPQAPAAKGPPKQIK